MMLYFSQIQKKLIAKRSQRGQAIIELLGVMFFSIIMLALIGSLVIYLYMQFTLINVARVGARAAAVNPVFTTSPATAEQSTEARVVSVFQQITGQTLTTDQVTVTPPDPAGTLGQRDVIVTVNFSLQNPLGGVATLLGAARTAPYDNIPMSATAIMRYEE